MDLVPILLKSCGAAILADVAVGNVGVLEFSVSVCRRTSKGGVVFKLI